MSNKPRDYHARRRWQDEAKATIARLTWLAH